MAASHFHPLRSSRVTLLAICLLAVLAGPGKAHAGDSVATGTLVLDPGKAVFVDREGTKNFGNAAIELRWKLDGQHLVDVTLTDRVHGKTLAVPVPFALVLGDGSTIEAGDMRLLSPPHEQ
ncbi:enterotoxin, partial [Rhodanobacter denitrificans]|nr:enterotoxin [Rhodanobacter denitrificans]